MGVTDEQINALTFYERSKAFDEREKAVILYADRVTRASTTIRDDARAALRHHFTDEQIVELTLVICAANFTNRFNNSLAAEPDLG